MVTEVALARFVTPLLTSALKRTVTSGISRTRLRRGGVSGNQKRMIELLESTELTAEFDGLAFFEELPIGVSVSGIERALSTAEMQACLKELIAISVTGAAPEIIDDRRSSFSRKLTDLLNVDDESSTFKLSEKIFDQLVGASHQISEKLKIIDKDEFSRLSEASIFYRMLSTLDAIDRHSKLEEAIADPEISDRFAAWEKAYQAQSVQAHGYIEPPDFERKKKILLKDLYVSPEFIPTSNRHDDRIELPQLISRLGRTVVLGDPGGGKSTVSRFIAHHFSDHEDARVIPFVVILRNLSSSDDSVPSIVDYIESRLANYYQCSPPPLCVESILSSGRGLVIFDGLDELLDVSRRRDVTDRVELFANRYPLTRILVTSRRVGYDQARLDPSLFEEFELSGFSVDNVRLYVQRWFATADALTEDESSRLSRSFVEESSSVPDLRRNPLMLALMCIIYRGEKFIPKNRPAVYERCANLLFERWDSSRKIHVELRVGDHVDAALKHLAYWMLTSESDVESVPESELVSECAKMLEGNFETEDDAQRAAGEFIDFCKGRAWVFSDAGSTAEGELLFKFTHRTFMEYFAAYHLTRIADTPNALGKILLPRVTKAEWDTVAQLAVQIFDTSRQDGAERVFRYLMEDGRKRSVAREDNMIGFVVRCLSFIPVSNEFITRITERVVNILLQLPTSTKLSERFGFFSFHTSANALVEVRDQSIGLVQYELSRHIENLLTGGTAEILVAKFLATEYTRWAITGGTTIRPMDPDSLTRWIKWANSEFESRKASILADDPNGEMHLICQELGLISLQEYLDCSGVASSNALVLDPFYRSATSSLLPASYGPISQSLFRDVTFRSQLHDSERIHRLDFVQDMLREAIPPYLTFGDGGAFFMLPFPRHGERFSVADDIRKYAWLITVLSLTQWEIFERFISVEGVNQTARALAPELLALTNIRLGVAEAVDLSNLLSTYSLSRHQLQTLESWVRAECDFVQPN